MSTKRNGKAAAPATSDLPAGMSADDVTKAIKRAADDIAAGKTPPELPAQPAPAPIDPSQLSIEVTAQGGNVVFRSALGPLLNLTVLTPETAVKVAKALLEQAPNAFKQRTEMP